MQTAEPSDEPPTMPTTTPACKPYRTLKSLFNRLRLGLLNVFYPQNNICHLCGRALARAGEVVLCSACEQELLACRLLQSEALSEHSPLKACLSAYAYVGAARSLVLGLKFGGDRAACLPIAAGLCDAYAEADSFRGFDIAVPVPLHVARMAERGYNQAGLLASELCGHIGLRLCEDTLYRVVNTKPQSGKSRAQRLVGVSGAFRASDGVRGANVLLVDDVLTTGATLKACAEALIDAGAASVSALTVSRADVGIHPD